MRAFPVSLPSGQRYWTVLDEDLQVVGIADEYLRHQRFGRDAAESTTKAYAHSIALFLRWCARSGRSWPAGVEQFALFMTWLARARPPAGDAAGAVIAGPGAAAVRCPSRINGVLTAVRGMVVHAVATGNGPAGLVSMLYEVADDRDLPAEARGEDGRMAWRMRARHRLPEPETAVDRATDEQIVALLRACRSARDKLKVTTIFCAPVARDPRCPDCGRPGRYRDTVIRPLTDLPVAGYPLVLRVAVPRYRCATPACGRAVFNQDLGKLAAPRASTTRRCARYVLRRLMIDRTTISAIAAELGVSWHTVSSIAMRATAGLIAATGPDRLAGVRVIGVDEHRWAPRRPDLGHLA